MISDSDIQDEDHTSSLHSAKSKDHNQNESKGLSSLPTTLLECIYSPFISISYAYFIF